jgi:hypothetical protein
MDPGNECRSEIKLFVSAHFQKCFQVFLDVIQLPGELSPELFFRLHLSCRNGQSKGGFSCSVTR